jgi:uncharacterized protein YukE
MNPTMDRIYDLIARLEAKIEAFQDKINSMLNAAPDILSFIIGKVRDAWNWFIGKVQEMWRTLLDALDNPGSPSELDDIAKRWLSDVGGPANKAGMSLEEDTLRMGDDWEGDGAQRYVAKIPHQVAALKSIQQDFAESVKAGIGILKTGIITYFVAIAAGLVTLIGCIVGAIASAATIFGLPAAPFIAGAGVLAFVGAVAGAVLVLSGQADSAETEFLNGAANGREKWPAFVAA